MRHTFTNKITSCNLIVLFSICVFGQTRVDELDQQRAEHVKHLAPERVGRVEEFVRRVKDDGILQRVNYGFTGLGLKVGGLVTGGGFAAGPQYLRDDLRNGSVSVRASAQASLKGYQKYEAALALPKLLNGAASFDVRATHRNYSGIPYYGPGPDSLKTRTNYRLEDTSIDGAFAVTPVRHLKVGGAAGFPAMNIGRGTDDRFVSSEAVFSSTQAPGIDRQSDFLRYGAFGQFDWRDDALGPRHGGNYVVQYTRFEDRDLKLHDFNLVDVDLQQYFSFFHKTRVIALRGHTRLTDVREGQSVPFYLQPIVGGPDDLRGFRPFRFSGNNSLALTGEYRWAIFSGLDGAVFADAGKVFARRGQLNFRDLESSAGFGLRFNARNQTFMRVDVGFSHEGFQVYFRFSDIFVHRPLGTADSQPIW